MKAQLDWQTVLEHFSPAWFAVVMGTGALSIALASFRSVLPLIPLQATFLALAVVIFVLLLAPWSVRFFYSPATIQKEFKHPVLAAFFPTMPISLLIIGIGLEKMAFLLPKSILAPTLLTLWVLGAAGIFLFALLLLVTFFQHPEIPWQSATFAWLIPPVSALIVPVLGFGTSSLYASNPIAQWIALISLLYLGMGSLLFLLVMGMVFSRHTLYAPPPSHLMPTLMIGVAPTSVLVILLLRLPIVLEQVWGAPEAVLQVLEWFTSIGAIALWGFSIFWLLLALLLNLVMWVRERPPFALSWWAYIFPMAAFVIASGVLYQVQTHPLFVGLGLAALTLLMLLWLLVFAKTLQGIWTGSLFSPHQPHAPSRPSS